MSTMDLTAAAPEVFLALAICGLLLVDVVLRDDQRRVTYYLSIVALIGAAATSAYYMPETSIVAFDGSFVADPAGTVLKMVAYLTVAVVFLYSRDYLEASGLMKGEFFLLSLFGLLGIMVLVSAHNLLTLYLGLELLALSQYALVAFNRESRISAESAMKYFV